MGAIEDVVKLFTVQRCVYWGNPVSDGNGNITYNAPIEIDCRWDEKLETIERFKDNKYSSQARVLVNIDVDYESYMFNGTLAQLQAIATTKGLSISKPKEFSTAYMVIQFEKIPMVFATDDFVRTAFLYNQG